MVKHVMGEYQNDCRGDLLIEAALEEKQVVHFLQLHVNGSMDTSR